MQQFEEMLRKDFPRELRAHNLMQIGNMLSEDYSQILDIDVYCDTYKPLPKIIDTNACPFRKICERIQETQIGGVVNRNTLDQVLTSEDLRRHIEGVLGRLTTKPLERPLERPKRRIEDIKSRIERLVKSRKSAGHFSDLGSQDSDLLSEICVSPDKKQTDDIGGLQHVITKIREEFLMPHRFPEFYFGTDASSSLLLFGLPGTGKTLLATAFAKESNMRLFKIKISTLLSKYVGDSEKRVDQIFDLARQEPTIIFIDEIDGLLSARHDSENQHSRSFKTQFLTRWGQDTNVIIIGATNCPYNLGEAVLRRFTVKIEVSFIFLCTTKTSHSSIRLGYLISINASIFSENC